MEIEPTLTIIKELKESKKHSNKHLTELSKDLRDSVTKYEKELADVKLQEEIALLYDVAIEMNLAFDKEVENKRLIDLAIKTEYENKLKAEAALKAKLEAEQKAIKDIEEIKKAKLLAEQNAANAAIEANNKAALAEVKRLYDVDQAKQLIIKQQKDKEQAILDEQAKRDANTSHKKAINNKILSELTTLGLDDEQAKAVIKAIVVGKVSNVTIKY